MERRQRTGDELIDEFDTVLVRCVLHAWGSWRSDRQAQIRQAGERDFEIANDKVSSD